MPLRVRLRALYLALGLKPIVQVLTVCPSALLVKFVGALPNLLLNRDQDGRLIGLRCECRLGGSVHVVADSFPFLDLVWTAIYPFVQLFSLPFQFVGFGAFLCHAYRHESLWSTYRETQRQCCKSDDQPRGSKPMVCIPAVFLRFPIER